MRLCSVISMVMHAAWPTHLNPLANLQAYGAQFHGLVFVLSQLVSILRSWGGFLVSLNIRPGKRERERGRNGHSAEQFRPKMGFKKGRNTCVWMDSIKG